MSYVHFFNGTLMPESEIAISPRDLGFTRGYAVFDFLKTYEHHRPFKLQEHVDRLFRSAELIGLVIPWSKDQVIAWVHETLAANESPEEKSIKIIITGGVSNSMVTTVEPTILILIDPAVVYPPHNYDEGVGIITVKHERDNFAAKSNNYIEGVKQTQIAQAQNAVEPVYYSDTQVFEGSNSNIFALINNQLVTPASHCLEGITRSVLLEILRLDIPVVARDFTHQELMQAQEVFLTGSGKEITPVTTINGVSVGDGKVGPVTKEVMVQFYDYVQSDRWL